MHRKIAELFIKNQIESYRGLVDEKYLESLYCEAEEIKWKKRYEEGCIHVHMTDDEMAGFISVIRTEEGWYIESLHVAEEFRGKGIGSMLLERILASHGRPVYICAVRGNDRAVKLYKKMGADHLEYFTDYFGDVPVDAEKLVWK